MTKAKLEERADLFQRQNAVLEAKNQMLQEQVNFFKQQTTQGAITPFLISVERLSESLAHALADLKSFRR